MRVARSPVHLRPARPEEAGALTRLMVRAKSSHGYDDETMRIFLPDLVVTPERIARDWVVVACAVRDGIPLGFAHVERRDDPRIVWLEDLFVDPDAQGQGLGTVLWDAVVAHARSLGATQIRFDADPNATGFYERLGAVVIGATPSTLIPGRTMPLMRYDVRGREEGGRGVAPPPTSPLPPPRDAGSACPASPGGRRSPRSCRGR